MWTPRRGQPRGYSNASLPRLKAAAANAEYGMRQGDLSAARYVAVQSAA